MAEWKRDDYEKLYKKLEAISSRMQLRKAIDIAAKKAANAGVKASKRRLVSYTTLSKDKIGETIKAYQYGSSLGRVTGMRISDRPRPLSDFNYTPKKPGKSKLPIMVEVYKGQNKQVQGKIDTPFIATMRSGAGHTGIYERVGDPRDGKPYRPRLPIKQLKGPTTVGMFKANEDIHQEVWNTIWHSFEDGVEITLHRILDA